MCVYEILLLLLMLAVAVANDEQQSVAQPTAHSLQAYQPQQLQKGEQKAQTRTKKPMQAVFEREPLPATLRLSSSLPLQQRQAAGRLPNGYLVREL